MRCWVLVRPLRLQRVETNHSRHPASYLQPRHRRCFTNKNMCLASLNIHSDLPLIYFDEYGYRLLGLGHAASHCDVASSLLALNFIASAAESKRGAYHVAKRKAATRPN